MTLRSELPPRCVDDETRALLVKTIKGLSMDAVEAARSGHPGMPMGMADAAAVLWSEFLVHDPADPSWPDRDRFVLSAGHGSMLLYSLLHLTGYDVSLDDIKNFRQWDSKTPGHPEVGNTPGVEVTTGPLGTGFAAGVGLALAERFLAGRYNRRDHQIVGHFTYGIVSDGDLMEGVASEAASFAGHQGLGKLIYLYDDNRITIDGSTDLSFSEDVAGRFEACGWHVQAVDGHDHGAVHKAIELARQEAARPSLICCRTTIGKGSPNKAGTCGVHGAPLGPDEVAASKVAMDWPAGPFHVPEALTRGMATLADQIRPARSDWDARTRAHAQAHPKAAAEFQRLMSGSLPEGIFDGLPTFEVGTSLATRKAGAQTLAALSATHPTLIGGSADLAGSNGVQIPESNSAQRDTPAGRNLNFGVREHGMGGICNGLALHGGIWPFDATFLVFSDFMRGCIRLSALMRLPVVHVFSHDSVFLGEDGPTHQPIEHAMSLRMIPNLHVVRPADATETVAAWKHALSRADGPTAILVTRQGVPVLPSSRDDISRGAYPVWEPELGASDPLDGLLLATGSEVWVAIEAAQFLQADHGRRVRVVSMPCWEAFEVQDEAYRESVLPAAVDRRLSVEAGVTLGWQKYASHHIGIDRFGASAPASVLAQKFGLTPTHVVQKFLAMGHPPS